ncbi:Arginine/ornithine antiporter ArcD [hydrothermal vent metagenome]|uniref:Arginine/ornithine antiporter ArcD n=1 Tax=hydrothermal vent metagenome TaxID=652676 RepID=A0A1W1C3R3_9ZZZZ
MKNKTSNKRCLPHFSVILSLPLLFLLGLILGYFGLIPLHVELHTLIIIGFIFIIFIFFIRHNANYAVCQMQISINEMEEKLKEALKENALTIMGETKSTLIIQEFLSEYYKDIRNDNFAKVATSVFPMLGILGTFIAIAHSMPDFRVENVDALDKEISVLLSGIGTAFYASIYGIFLSLLWTYFEKRGSAKVDNNLYNLEKVYNKHIWKRRELIKHEHQQSEFRDQLIVNTLKETFNLDFIKELTEYHIESYKTVAEETNKNFNLLKEDMKIVLDELKNTINMVEDRQESLNAVSQIKSNIEGFNKNAQKVEESLNHFDNSVDRTFVKIDSEIGEVVEKLSEFALVISEQNREMQESLRLQKLENSNHQ